MKLQTQTTIKADELLQYAVHLYEHEEGCGCGFHDHSCNEHDECCCGDHCDEHGDSCCGEDCDCNKCNHEPGEFPCKDGDCPCGKNKEECECVSTGKCKCKGAK